MLSIGVGLWSAAFSGGTPGPRITITASSISEDAIIGDAVGTLSVANGSGVYTFSITADPDSKFAIDGAALELAATVDYETATFHSVTISADNGVDDPITRSFTIFVTDVAEASGPDGDGILLESGDFLLAEDGNYLILEAA
jgi:hypothetical protein